MGAGLTGLLDDRNRQRLAALGLLELRQPQRGRQPCGTSADNQDVNFEGFSCHQRPTKKPRRLRGLRENVFTKELSESLCLCASEASYPFSNSATSAGAISKMSPWMP